MAEHSLPIDDADSAPEFVRRYVSRRSVLAVQLTEDADWDAIAAWCGGELVNHEPFPGGDPETCLELPSLDQGAGWLGDWVVLEDGRFDTVRGPLFPVLFAPVDSSTDTPVSPREACEKVRGAFAFMPILNAAFGPGDTIDQLRREVNEALDWCLPAVYAALDGTTEAEARKALNPAPVSTEGETP